MAHTAVPSAVEVLAGQAGFTEYGYVPVGSLRFSGEIRKICEGNSCRSYGTTWACPPAVGTLEECRRRVERFDTMLLLTKRYDLESSFDFEAMGAGLKDFKKTVDRFHTALAPVLPEFLLLSNEGCGRCAECTYPEAPCRFPELLHHSLEGYGFVVSGLAEEAGVRYNNGPGTVTFFGALLFRSDMC